MIFIYIQYCGRSLPDSRLHGIYGVSAAREVRLGASHHLGVIQ